VSQPTTIEDQALLAALAALEPAAAAGTGGPGEAPAGGPAVASLPGLTASLPAASTVAAPASSTADAPAGLAADSPAGLTADSDTGQREAQETLTRLYHEVLGLIPWSLPPISPDPAVKRRLMAAISAGGAPAAAGAAEDDPKSAGGPLALPRPVALRPPSAAVADGRVASSPAGRRAGTPGRAWLGLAAALILALVAACGWLYQGLLERGDAIAQLSAERNAARHQAAAMAVRLERMTAEVNELRDHVSIVTSPAVEACPLGPSAPAAPQAAGARGVLFVAADHQHWYMSLRGLRPAGAGKVYQLWFLGDQGPVSAGTFRGETGAPWELGSEHMPAGTREVRITMEDGTGAPAPSGPEVLRNTEAFRVL
jgi:Anti-sigma-K factor rskA